MMVVAVNRALRTASVCDKYQIIRCQRNGFLLSTYLAFNRGGSLFISLKREENVGNFRIVLEGNACLFQIFYHGKNQGFILIVLGKFQRGEIRQSTDMMDKTLDIKLHFQRTVPVFKGEHGSPVQPEIRGKYLVIEEILNLFVIQLFLCGKEQLHDFHTALLA